MPKPSQLTTTPICVAREGLTVDGREIPREHIQEIAQNYDPELYSARINKEHFRAFLFDDEFPTLGDVISLSTDERDGKMCLLANIRPTSDLVKLNERQQKVFTSIEYDIDAVDGKDGAYLMGLAVTDSPAVTGTDRLCFSIKHKDEPAFKDLPALSNNFSEYIETDAFQTVDPKPSALDKVKAIFAKGEKARSLQASDHAAAIEAIAESVVETKTEFSAELGAAQKSQADALAVLAKEFGDLKATLENTPSSQHKLRPPSGGDAAHLADC